MVNIPYMDGMGIYTWIFLYYCVYTVRAENHLQKKTPTTNFGTNLTYLEDPWQIHIWGSVKIPCWPACLESLGHRSGWGPHRFTWFGYMVLISVLICKGIPLSWSRSDLVSAWHLGGLRCPWPPSSNASPLRWSSTAQKKKLTAHTPANPPAPFFWKGRATVVCFSFYISSFHIYSRINLAQWLVRTASNRKVPGSSPACGAFAFLFTRGVTS